MLHKFNEMYLSIISNMNTDIKPLISEQTLLKPADLLCSVSLDYEKNDIAKTDKKYDSLKITDSNSTLKLSGKLKDVIDYLVDIKFISSNSDGDYDFGLNLKLDDDQDFDKAELMKYFESFYSKMPGLKEGINKNTKLL